MNILIREGKVSDLASILELIYELAILKNEKVKIDIYDLIKDGFSIKPLFKTYVAQIDNHVVGFVLFYPSYSTNGKSLIIEDVFVSNKNKKSGIGLTLFSKCLEYANKNNIQLMEWTLFKKYESLIELYERAGATILWNTRVYNMNNIEIAKSFNNIKLKDKISKENFIIRFGKIDDMPKVIGFMKKIATYKYKTCDLDVYDLVKDGFGKKPLFNSLVLEYKNKVIGVLLFYYAYSCFVGKSLIIEDIMIDEKHRGFGFGQVLSSKLLEFAIDNNINRIQQAIFNYDKKAIQRCLASGAKETVGVRLVQINYSALEKFINRDL